MATFTVRRVSATFQKCGCGFCFLILRDIWSQREYVSAHKGCLSKFASVSTTVMYPVRSHLLPKCVPYSSLRKCYERKKDGFLDWKCAGLKFQENPTRNTKTMKSAPSTPVNCQTTCKTQSCSCVHVWLPLAAQCKDLLHSRVFSARNCPWILHPSNEEKHLLWCLVRFMRTKPITHKIEGTCSGRIDQSNVPKSDMRFLKLRNHAHRSERF